MILALKAPKSISWSMSVPCRCRESLASPKTRSRGSYDAGIEYQHRVALGTPKPMRTRYKRDHDFAALPSTFEKYLTHQDPLRSLSWSISSRQARLPRLFRSRSAIVSPLDRCRAREELGAPKAKHFYP